MPQRNASPERARRPSSEPGPRRQPPGAATEVASVLQIGSALGNRTTATLLAGGLLQRKVAIGPADDPLERQAERAADRVLAAPATPAHGGSGAGASPPPVATEPVASGATVQRECAACAAGGGRCAECEEKDEELRRAGATGQSATGADSARLESRLSALGPGRPLSPGLRGFFEPRFGHDFGTVRLHSGPTAAAAATAARARAFTLRRDVVFGSGEYAPESRRGRHLIAHELAHVVQQAPASGGSPVVRRQPAAGGATLPEPAASEASAPAAAPGPVPEPVTEETAASLTAAAPAERQDGVRDAAAPRGLIVADEVEPGPEQMTRSAFLDELHVAACSASEQGLAGTGRSAEGCPWIDHYFRVYRGLGAERIEADLRRYAPATRSASRARDYIAPVAEHIRASVRRWAETGELTGVPQGLPGMGLLGAIGGSLAGLGRLFFKARSGDAAAASAHPAAVAARLGSGSPLPGTVRSRMESSFGSGLGDVRVHTDATAARLAGRFNARAFTVGPHVAFGAGEYRPGTPVGDVLLAHELAHVAQQGGGTATTVGAAAPAELERDADRVAAHAAAGLLRSGRPGTQARTRRRTGLRLQRCGGEKKVQGRPGMGLAPGLAPGVDTKEYSLNEYITMWEAAAGRSMTDRERERLAAGCVGITRLNIGGAASLSECYDTFDQAKKRADELEKEFGKRPFIFSKRFWSMGAAYPADPATGKVDMSGYTGATPPGEVNFDYGWYDETTNTWWHANHCDPVIAGGTCAEVYSSTKRMKVYQSTLAHYSDPHYFGADVQVFCVAWSKLTK